MRTPTLENPWPDSTRARVQACVEQGASDLPEGQSTVHIDLFVTPEGHVQEVRAKGATLAARDVQTCIKQALEAMTVPSFVLEQAPLASSEQSISTQSRELMGDVTVLTGAALEEALTGLGPMVVEAGPVGVAVIVGVFVLAAVGAWGSQRHTTRCKKEWRIAREKCADMLAQQNPPHGVTGGETEIFECAEGLVRHVCGGKRIEDGADPRPGRRM